MTCRACHIPVKKNAVVCEECMLICHASCAPEAPEVCLRTSLSPSLPPNGVHETTIKDKHSILPWRRKISTPISSHRTVITSTSPTVDHHSKANDTISNLRMGPNQTSSSQNTSIRTNEAISSETNVQQLVQSNSDQQSITVVDPETRTSRKELEFGSSRKSSKNDCTIQ